MAGFERSAFFTKEKDTGRMPKLPSKNLANIKPFKLRMLSERPPPKNNELDNSKKNAKEINTSREMQKKSHSPKHMTKAPSAAAIRNPASVIRNADRYLQKHLYYKDAKNHTNNYKPPAPPQDPSKKLTWNGLENISYRDIKGNEDFNPANLVEGDKDDAEIALILGKFGNGPQPTDNSKYSKKPPTIKL